MAFSGWSIQFYATGTEGDHGRVESTIVKVFRVDGTLVKVGLGHATNTWTKANGTVLRPLPADLRNRRKLNLIFLTFPPGGETVQKLLFDGEVQEEVRYDDCEFVQIDQ